MTVHLTLVLQIEEDTTLIQSTVEGMSKMEGYIYKELLRQRVHTGVGTCVYNRM